LYAFAATWRVHPFGRLRPLAVTQRRRPWDVLRTDREIGMAAMELVLTEGQRVGPVVRCAAHRAVDILVMPWDPLLPRHGGEAGRPDLFARPVRALQGLALVPAPGAEHDDFPTDFAIVDAAIRRTQSLALQHAA
jgi:hypothetical protein